MVGYHQPNLKRDTGKTLKRWPVLVDHYSKFSGKLIDTIQGLAVLPENTNAVMANAQANRNISVQIGDTTIYQSIASSDPQKATSLSSDAYNKANRLTYQNLMSAISPN
ncbi:hypothetical protein OSB94_17480 [Proteus vulgaris]|nr:hypothetical protein [Proteus vulgaris]MDS0789890.1 hypothetical protein [Proteus vulgaris]